MKIEFKYVPLSFISADEAILQQLKNTQIFKVIMQEYQTLIPLSDLIISSQYGYTASAKENGTNKLLRITDIKQGSVNWNNVPHCDCDREEKYVLNKGDVLIARTGNNISYLVADDVPKNAVFASYLIRFVCDNTKLLPEYLFLFLNSYAFWSQILLKQRGATLQNVNAKLMGQLLIPICHIDKQKEIIDKANTLLNTKIQNEVNSISKIYNNKSNISTHLTHQLDLVKKLRQSFLREAMQGKLVAQNPNDEPATELLAKIKAEKEQLIKEKKLKRGKASSQSVSLIDEVEIPTTWIWAKTDEIFFVTKLAGFEYSKHISLKPSGEIPVIRAQNVRPFEINKSNLLYIDRKTSELLNRCALTKEVLLVTFIGAGIGDVARFYENERWHLAPNVAKLEPFEGCESMMNLKFINYFLMSDNGRAELFKHVKATAQPSLSMGTIRDIDIPLPPLSEQKRIVAKLDKLMAYCDSLEESIKNSKTQNEMLLGQVLREALEPDKLKEKSY